MRNRPGRRPHAAPCGALHRGLPAVLLIQFHSVSSARPTESAPPRPFPGRQRPSSPGSQTGGAFASCIVPCVCTFHKRRRAPQRPAVHRIPCVHAHSDLIRAVICTSPMRSGAFQSAPPAPFDPHRQRFSIRTASTFQSAQPQPLTGSATGCCSSLRCFLWAPPSLSCVLHDGHPSSSGMPFAS